MIQIISLLRDAMQVLIALMVIGRSGDGLDRWATYVMQKGTTGFTCSITVVNLHHRCEPGAP